MSAIELKHLRYADTAELFGSFRQAADALGIKQSNLSRRAVEHPSQDLWPVPHCSEIDWRRARAFRWQRRAKLETQLASRTWSGVLTLTPENHYHFSLQAMQEALRQGELFEALPRHEQFSLRHNAVSPEITKYMKRIRKESSAPIRFLLVAEAHLSGLPHYHCLIHEVDPDRHVTYAVLTRQWHLGFSHYRLVTDFERATYLYKRHLRNPGTARVRASLNYGIP